MEALQSLPVAASNKKTLSEEQMIDIAPLDLSALLGTGKFHMTFILFSIDY